MINKAARKKAFKKIRGLSKQDKELLASLHVRDIKNVGDLLIALNTNQQEVKAEAPIPTTILEEAKSLVFGERNKHYKHPTENFNNISNLWNAYFTAIAARPGVASKVSAEYAKEAHLPEIIFQINNIDVAYLNILQKVARGATNQQHIDSIRDIAGYSLCIERILKNF